MAADAGQHALLELELLGNVFLDEIGLGGHGVQVGREGQPALARQRRQRQARQRPLGVRHRAADPFLHLRLHVGGDHIDAEMQRARRPAAADDPGTQQTERLDLSHVTAAVPRKCRRGAPAVLRPALPALSSF